MKIWTLVWFLIYPANDEGMTTWEIHQVEDITLAQCASFLAKKDEELRELTRDGKIVGHEIYCKEVK